jgi:hypothetical protein
MSPPSELLRVLKAFKGRLTISVFFVRQTFRPKHSETSENQKYLKMKNRLNLISLLILILLFSNFISDPLIPARLPLAQYRTISLIERDREDTEGQYNIMQLYAILNIV